MLLIFDGEDVDDDNDDDVAVVVYKCKLMVETKIRGNKILWKSRLINPVYSHY